MKKITAIFALVISLFSACTAQTKFDVSISWNIVDSSMTMRASGPDLYIEYREYGHPAFLTDKRVAKAKKMANYEIEEKFSFTVEEFRSLRGWMNQLNKAYAELQSSDDAPRLIGNIPDTMYASREVRGTKDGTYETSVSSLWESGENRQGIYIAQSGATAKSVAQGIECIVKTRNGCDAFFAKQDLAQGKIFQVLSDPSLYACEMKHAEQN